MGRWLEGSCFPAGYTTGKGLCCLSPSHLYHVHIVVHATVTRQHSQYLALMHTHSIILDWPKMPNDQDKEFGVRL